MTNTLPHDSGNIAYEGVRLPGSTQFAAQQGGTPTTDGDGVISAPNRVEATDGALATVGTTTDSAYAGSGSATGVSIWKGLYALLASILRVKVVDSAGTNQLAVDASGKIGVNNLPTTQPVSGTVAVSNLPGTQPVSGTVAVSSLPALPTGGNAIGSVSVSNLPGTQPVSGAITANAGTNLNTSALALETGGNLAGAKSDLDTIVTQTANVAKETGGHLATVDTSTAAVSTTTGATTDAAVTSDANGTLSAKLRGLVKILADVWDSTNHRLKVDGSGVTQPVSGTVTANAGTNLNTSALAIESGGHLAAIDTSNSAINTATGAQADAAYTSGSGSIIALLKGIFTRTLAAGQAAMAASSPVVIASDQSNVPVVGGTALVSGAGTGTVNGNNTDFIASMDVSAYRGFSLDIAGTFNLVLRVQVSNDNTNWYDIQTITSNGTGGSASSSISSSGHYTPVAALEAKYLRVRCTAYVSNTSLAGNAFFSTTGNQTQNGQINILATPTTVGGTTVARIDSAATTNSTLTKNGAGNLYGGHFGNNGASDAWVKLYNKVSAPTVGTDTPFLVVYVPKGTAVPFPVSLIGITLSAGIGYGVTGGAGDTDTTAVAAHQVSGWFEYK